MKQKLNAKDFILIGVLTALMWIICIQNADQILVINNGQISQHGTHEELMKQPGIYQDFVNIRKNAAGWSLA